MWVNIIPITKWLFFFKLYEEQGRTGAALWLCGLNMDSAPAGEAIPVDARKSNNWTFQRIDVLLRMNDKNKDL